MEESKIEKVSIKVAKESLKYIALDQKDKYCEKKRRQIRPILLRTKNYVLCNSL